MINKRKYQLLYLLKEINAMSDTIHVKENELVNSLIDEICENGIASFYQYGQYETNDGYHIIFDGKKVNIVKQLSNNRIIATGNLKAGSVLYYRFSDENTKRNIYADKYYKKRKRMAEIFEQILTECPAAQFGDYFDRAIISCQKGDSDSLNSG